MQSVDSLCSMQYNKETKRKYQEIEVAFFKSTFYEVSGTDEEKGKEKTPKVRTA